jgi:hypothetical protein
MHFLFRDSPTYHLSSPVYYFISGNTTELS